MIVLRHDDRRPRAWKNGQGTSSDVVIHPPGEDDDFIWRLSVATIEADSAFSFFPGVDRILMPLSKSGLVLRDDRGRHPVGCFESFAFGGESPIAAADVAEPSLDLNLMTRRGRATGTLSAARLEGELVFASGSGSTTVVVLLEGMARVDDGADLGILDALRLDFSAAVLRGRGVLGVVTVESDPGVAGR